MEKQNVQHFNQVTQGTVILIAGILLLLYSLNIVTAGITFLLIIVAVGLIFYGASASGVDILVKRFFNHLRQYFNHKSHK